MEMNTRLQVEHPVTEMIVGQDLVEWQIRVANGEPLPLTQSEVPFSGHAFEARIYAENVPKGFLPATGVLHHYCPVTATSAVRVETGVEEGDTVSMHYDPMIAKLVVWGQDRLSALIKMKDCLSKFQVAGLPTNIDFIIKLASHRAFQNGEVETHFIERYKDDLFIDGSNSISVEKAESAAKHAASIVAACICQNELATLKDKAPGGLHLWYGNPPFRINHFAKRTVDLEWENQYSISGSNLLTVSITYLPDGKYLVETGEINSPGLEIQVTQLSNNDYRVEVDGLSLNVCLAAYSKVTPYISGPYLQAVLGPWHTY
uniref:Biotin-containing subunit of methylcrotonyl-CoA carboxylase n=1 Tax=Solanum tuberosum TaxID=4113 RepID=M1BPD9_SOLTU